MNISLATLRERYVFEATPVRGELGALHVPFDRLTATQLTEQRLDDSVRGGEPVALIGPSGSGKSSIIAHVLGPLHEAVAPMPIPVAAMPRDTVDHPTNLVDHLLDTVARAASAVNLEASVDEARTSTSTVRRSTRRAGLGGSFRFLRGDLGREVVKQTTVEHRATFADKTEILSEVFRTIEETGPWPVLVFDDTDRWLSDGGEALASSFFGETMRWMLDLPVGLVAAVHPSYFEVSSRAEVLSFLDTQIDVPRLTSADHIAAILAHRMATRTGEPFDDLSRVLDPEATHVLFELYQEVSSLRRVIQVCHTALHEAVSAGADRIWAGHVVAAANAG